MSSVLHKTDGEVLVKKIRDAMWERGITMEQVAKKAKIGKTTLYKYLDKPGAAPLSKILAICRAVGIQQVTLMTAGTFYN
jgi:DNA-binding phage protein